MNIMAHESYVSWGWPFATHPSNIYFLSGGSSQSPRPLNWSDFAVSASKKKKIGRPSSAPEPFLREPLLISRIQFIHQYFDWTMKSKSQNYHRTAPNLQETREGCKTCSWASHDNRHWKIGRKSQVWLPHKNWSPVVFQPMRVLKIYCDGRAFSD